MWAIYGFLFISLFNTPIVPQQTLPQTWRVSNPLINAAVSQNSIALIGLVGSHLSSVPLLMGTVLSQKVGAHANLKQGDKT